MTRDDSDSESGREIDDEDGVNGSASVGKAILVGDGRGRIKFEETRRLSSLFRDSSLAKAAHTPSPPFGDPQGSTSLAEDDPTAISRATSVGMGDHDDEDEHGDSNTHSGSDSDDSDSESGSRRIPSPTRRSRSHFNLAIRKGQRSPSPLSKSIVQLREGSPDSHLPSDERSYGDHDDEDEHGDSNAHSGSDSESGSGSSSGPEGHLGLSNMGPLAVGQRTVIHVMRRITEGDVMWNRRGLGCVERDASGFWGDELGTGPIRRAIFVEAYAGFSFAHFLLMCGNMPRTSRFDIQPRYTIRDTLDTDQSLGNTEELSSTNKSSKRHNCEILWPCIFGSHTKFETMA
ncbi:hypothetical protein BU17DRAFT_60436 [Hysterangium stoloniferum]|nr:hypothetical protein BU17DRAFT_60436 [Hysterangium stoloniferum]